jgi:hypothetical protein
MSKLRGVSTGKTCRAPELMCGASTSIKNAVPVSDNPWHVSNVT